MKAKILDKSENPLRAAVSQVDGGRWVTLEGLALVTADKEKCREGTQSLCPTIFRTQRPRR